MSFIEEEDKGLWKYIQEKIGEETLAVKNFKYLLVETELLSLVKTEDFYKDGSTLKRVLKKVKGKSPNIDSVVKGMKSLTLNTYTCSYDEDHCQ